MTTAQDVAQEHLLRFQRVASEARGADAALSASSFTLGTGSRASLVGPPGAGSLALDLIAAVAPPPHGRIVLFGADAGDIPRSGRCAFRRRLGLMLQALCLVDELSVFDNLALAAQAIGRSREDYGPKAVELLTWVGLGRRMSQDAGSLDLEGLRRVSLARALMNGPDLLLIDDPVKALPPPATRAVLKLIDEAHGAGIAVLMTVDGDGAAGADGSIIRLASIASPLASTASVA